jgi:hypothetical protein
MKNNLVEFAEWWKSVYKEKLAAVYIDERFTNDKRYEMNEKIKQLAEQSGLDYMPDHDLAKFAELIVRECAEVANEHNTEAEGITLGVGRVIKEHFGVE